jgi:type I restriction enzyme S subunit
LAIAQVPVAVNQGFIAMICSGALSNHYVLHWTAENMDEILARSGGTTFGEISKSNFRPIPVIVPAQDILQRYDVWVGKLHVKIVANLREIRTLATIRDALLPRLLSGEIRVKPLESKLQLALPG